MSLQSALEDPVLKFLKSLIIQYSLCLFALPIEDLVKEQVRKLCRRYASCKARWSVGELDISDIAHSDHHDREKAAKVSMIIII